jgi:hypothetical protein
MKSVETSPLTFVVVGVVELILSLVLEAGNISVRLVAIVLARWLKCGEKAATVRTTPP